MVLLHSCKSIDFWLSFDSLSVCLALYYEKHRMKKHTNKQKTKTDTVLPSPPSEMDTEVQKFISCFRDGTVKEKFAFVN